jgi:hypothetical protein
MRGVSPRLVVAAALLGALPGAAVPAEAPQQIGSWVVECPAPGGAGGCMMRDRDWILAPTAGRPSVALEVQGRGGRLVPVVALRGLTAQAVPTQAVPTQAASAQAVPAQTTIAQVVTVQAAIGALLVLQPQVTLRFDAGPRADLACGLDGGAIVCAPEGAAMAATAAALPTARSVEVQVAVRASGTGGPAARAATLDLQGTREAMARFRAAGPIGEALPAEPGLDWIGFVDRVAREAGLQNGIADLVPRLAGVAGRGGS